MYFLQVKVRKACVAAQLYSGPSLSMPDDYKRRAWLLLCVD